MDKAFGRRLEALEKLEHARQGLCRGYVVLAEDGETMLDDCPCGGDGPHKAYIIFSPSEWDPDLA